jgi:hypothetical protein
MRLKLVTCVTVAGLVLAGCASHQGKPSGSAPAAGAASAARPADPTAYERVLGQVGPAGTVTKDTALAAFAAAIAPLPGSRRPRDPAA